MTTLIDMIRGVPEAAVRLWCGKHSGDLKVQEADDGVRITYEKRSAIFPLDVFKQAEEVAKILSIRPRMLRTVQDVLEIRHDAEDIFTQIIFGRKDAPKALFVPAGVAASGFYRAMIPSDLMRETGKVVSHFTMNLDLYKAIRYDVLWIQLITAPVLIEIVRKAKEQGLKIVYDIDDRLDAIPEWNQAISVYGTPDKQDEIRTMIALADLVTVSTAPLARWAVEKMGAKEARLLPNMMTANVAPRRHPPNPAFTKILWAGSPTHKNDLAIMAPAMRSVLQRHAGKVRFTCFGERLPEELSGCYDFIDLQDPVDFESYHDKIATIAADFAIAPLEENAFNESKSAIKALEYASAGYPMLLSPVGEYPVVVEAGLPAELVKNDEWESALERMIGRTREERAAIGKASIEWVCKNRCMGSTKASAWTDVVLDLTRKVNEGAIQCR
jgi:glycosyltransferase involved in cell wall biosynthesis